MLECYNCGKEAIEELKTVFVNSIFQGCKWEEKFCSECYSIIEERENKIKNGDIGLNEPRPLEDMLSEAEYKDLI